MFAQFPNNDKEIATRLQSGDERAFVSFYKQYSAQIFKRLLRLVKQEAVAEELLQDVFMRIWETKKNIDPEKPFRPYLYRIAQNLVIDLYRRAAYDKQFLTYLIEAVTELHDPAKCRDHEAEVSHLLKKAIDMLPPQRRKIYMLCKLEGKTYGEVSQLLGISVSTVSDHIVKATKTLKTYAATRTVAISLLAATLFNFRL